MVKPAQAASESMDTALVGGPLPDAPAETATTLPRTAAVAAHLVTACAAAGKNGLIYLAASERRAEEIGRALHSLLPAVASAVLRPWDCLPYDRASPSQECMGHRMAALAALGAKDGARVLVTSPEALMQRVPPREACAERFDLAVGAALDREALEVFAARTGYSLDDRIEEPGEIAFLGHVVDVFPADAAAPVRLALAADGSIEDMRHYDPVSQRSSDSLEALVLRPASEAVTATPDERRPGAEHRLSELFPALGTAFDLLPKAKLVAEEGGLDRCGRFLDQVSEAYQSRRTFGGIEGTATLPPDRLYLTAEEFAAAMKRRASVALDCGAASPTPSFSLDARPAQAARDFVRDQRAAGHRVVLSGLPHERRQIARVLRLKDEVAEETSTWAAVLEAKPGTLHALAADLDGGFVDESLGLACVTASDLFGARAAAPSSTPATVFADLDMQVGDVVVHEDHGFGILQGLERIEAGDRESDAIRLLYHAEATLLVPVDEFDRIWRYGSEPDAVTLDRLRTEGWAKRRAKVETYVQNSAQALVALAKERAAARTKKLVPDRTALARFTARFAFPETADQAAAVAAVLADLASGTPMNRLVCGDVGFGKTEIALRAAAAVALCGKQVALVAPTTVLVRQHVETFRRRFAGTGIAIVHLSRIVSAAEAKEAKRQLGAGKAGIVIGTQAVFGKDVVFDDLGLVIIDEEHRFGTKAKEALHGQAPHLLSLTATPIPRTLQGALVGVQDVSVLATPPARRRPIRTFLAPFDAAATRTALLREKRRGGQSFIVVPRIQDIEPMLARLADIVPELDVGVAHGDLDPDAIDEVMVAFGEGQRDVLLATNMIESGLDVPRANTMLVWRADRFGLAQLHQLRGRVGRGRAQGTVTLLTDPDDEPAEATTDRLATLEAFDRLGAGFAISARDLDQRGAGDLAGEDAGRPRQAHRRQPLPPPPRARGGGGQGGDGRGAAPTQPAARRVLPHSHRLRAGAVRAHRPLPPLRPPGEGGGGGRLCRGTRRPFRRPAGRGREPPRARPPARPQPGGGRAERRVRPQGGGDGLRRVRRPTPQKGRRGRRSPALERRSPGVRHARGARRGTARRRHRHAGTHRPPVSEIFIASTANPSGRPGDGRRHPAGDIE